MGKCSIKKEISIKMGGERIVLGSAVGYLNFSNARKNCNVRAVLTNAEIPVGWKSF